MKATHLHLEDGLSALAVVGIMVLLSIFGLAIASLVTTSHSIRVSQVFYDQANFVNQAGIEYALRKVYEGTSPVTGDIQFGNGSFQVGRSGSTITVTGLAGDAQVVHSVTQPTQADCLEIDTSESHTHSSGKEIRRIYLTKTCLESIVLDKMIFSWSPDNGESYDKVRIEGLPNTHLYDAPPRVRSGQTAELIDVPMRRNNRYKLEEIRFRTDMRTKSFSLNFLMGDGSSQVVNFTLGPCPHPSC